MPYPRTESEKVAVREQFSSAAETLANGWSISAGSSVLGGSLNLSAQKEHQLLNFFNAGGSIRLRITPNDSDATFRRMFFMGVDTNFKMQLGVLGSTGGSILELRNGSGNNYYVANQTLTIGAVNEIVLVWDPNTAKLTSYINGSSAVVDTSAGSAGWGGYDTTYGTIKIGSIAGGSSVTDMDTDLFEMYSRLLTAEEVADLYEATTFPEIDDSKATLALPLRTQYDNGSAQVTDHEGTFSGTITVGDGTTSSTYPTQLAPKGMDFDGVNDYLEASGPVVAATGAFTVSALVRADDFSVTRGICGQYYDTIGERLDIGLNSTNAFLQIGGTVLNYAYGDNIQAGHIFHIVTGRDSSNNTYLYIDGVLRASGTNATNVDQQAMMIGRYTQAAVNTLWKGAIYTFRVFSEPLSATQAKELYNRDRRLLNF